MSASWVAVFLASAIILVIVARAVVRAGGFSTWWTTRAGRAEATRRRERAGVIRPIADAKGDEVRVRGRVRAVRPVRTPDGELCAAFRVRGAATGCGRFTIDDWSGVAVVDASAGEFALEELDPLERDGAPSGQLVLRDGDLVEVVGRARHGAPSADVLRAVPAHQKDVLVFEAKSDLPIVLVPLGVGASMAPPKLHPGTASTPQHGALTEDHEALGEVEAGGRAEAEEAGRYTRG